MPSPTIDAYVSQPHYWRHMAPIWYKLPGDLRGMLYDETIPMNHRNLAPFVMCAGYNDAMFVGDLGRKVIYVEHGAGQSYTGIDLGNYSGGDGFGPSAVLFICPSETVAGRWRSRYPTVPAVAVGCPKMDRYIHPAPYQRQPIEPVVAITFHWNALVCPESRSAFDHYRNDLHTLVKLCEDHCVQVMAHSHPHWDDPQFGGDRGFMMRFWNGLGAIYTPFEDDVLSLGTLLIADNTSLMYEFASLKRPVIALNAPWYRRDVEHGLRFWSHVPGIQADTPVEMLDTVESYLELVDARGGIAPSFTAPDLVPYVYSSIDGGASERAAQAIEKVIRAYV